MSARKCKKSYRHDPKPLRYQTFATRPNPPYFHWSLIFKVFYSPISNYGRLKAINTHTVPAYMVQCELSLDVRPYATNIARPQSLIESLSFVCCAEVQRYEGSGDEGPAGDQVSPLPPNPSTWTDVRCSVPDP
jgi:hypothetical protein